MRPTDFCTPKHFDSSTLSFAVSQRCAPPFERGLAASSCGVRTRPEPFGSCSSMREVSSLRTALSPVRRRTREAPAGSGPSDANEAGEHHASQHGTRFDDLCVELGGALSSPPLFARPSLTPLSPPLEWIPTTPLLRTPTESSRGRQDRFRGRPVNGVRFVDPGCLPPAAPLHNPPRTEMREGPQRVARMCGVHVMRTAVLRATAPMHRPGLCAYARRTLGGGSPRSRAPEGTEAFDPVPTGLRASLGAGDVYRFSAN